MAGIPPKPVSSKSTLRRWPRGLPPGDTHLSVERTGVSNESPRDWWALTLSSKVHSPLQLIATKHIRVALHRMDHNGVACPADADEILHRENPKLIGYRRPPPGYRRPPHDRFI